MPFPTQDLPLFPLQSVLFPGGRLALKIFEARYLDLISRCLREGTGFGVVGLSQGSEVLQPSQAGQPVRFEPVGVLARLQAAEAEGTNLLKIWCEGGPRFKLLGDAVQQQGLWVAPQVAWLDDDLPTPPGDRFAEAAAALGRALDALEAMQPPVPALAQTPRRLDDAGWVANRWCELLPISRVAKQKLMELDEPLTRLGLVDDFLRKQKVI